MIWNKKEKPIVNLQKGDMPERIGKYEIRGKLGRGACGVVYKGYDPFVQREVAVKVSLTDEEEGVHVGKDAERAFFSEAHASGKLQHPHIVSLFDAGFEDGLSYIVMEYIDGETLLEYCRPDGKRLSTSQAIECMFKAAKALDYSHKENVIHRDIKPSNIMLSRDGETKIMDFSIAEVKMQTIFKPDSVIGSPSYMAPEQVTKDDIGSRSDLYSLGAVMYQLLTGERPFVSADVQEVFKMVVNKTAPLVKEKRPDLPTELSIVVAKLLEKDPDKRYQTGQELANQLVSLFDSLRYTEQKIERGRNRDALRDLSFFTEFTDEHIDEILAASRIITFQKGGVVIQEGEIDTSFYIIAKGIAEVQKGGKKIVNLMAGDCFGEIGFLTASKRTASIIADSELVVLKVNAIMMEQVSVGCQLNYYKAFNQTLIYRLALTSARLTAKDKP